MVKKGVACTTLSRWSWAENFFSGGSVAPDAKCYQLFRAIGRKKCFLNKMIPFKIQAIFLLITS